MLKIITVLAVTLFACVCARYPDELVFISEKCPNYPGFWCNSVDSAKLCGKLEYCKKYVWSKEKEIPSNNLKVPKSNDICDKCKAIVNYYKELIISNFTEASFEDFFINEICLHIKGSFSQECITLVRVYAPVLLRYLHDMVNAEDLCERAQFCNAQLHDNVLYQDFIEKLTSSPVADGDFCKPCMTFVASARTILGNDKYMKLAQKAAKDFICTSGGFKKSMCDKMIDLMFPTVYISMITKMDPQKVCKILTLCSSKDMNNLKMNFPPLLPIEGPKANGAVCQDCMKFIGVVRDELKNKSTVDEVKSLLKYVCMYMGPMASECRGIIDQYTPVVIDMLVKYLDPTTVCRYLHLCPQNLTTSKNLFSEVSKVKDSVICKDCVNFVDAIRHDISSKTTVQELENLFDFYVCNLLLPVKAQCKAVVHKYAPMILNMITDAVDSRKICTLINLCQPSFSKSDFVLKEVSKVKDSVICKDCVKFLDAIRHDISSNTTAQELENIFDFFVCNLLLPVKSQCKAAVHKYAPMILKMLSDAVDSRKICVLINLCQQKLSKSEVHVKEKYPVCFECTELLTFIKSLHEKKYFEKYLETFLLEEICQKSGAFRNVCTTFVKQSVDGIVGILLDNMQPYKSCQVFGLCKNAPHSPLLNILKKTNQLRANGFDKCKFCLVSLEIVQRLLSDPILQGYIQSSILDGICPLLKKSSQECKDYTRALLPIIFNYVVKELNPKTLCAEFHACIKTTKKEATPFHDKPEPKQSITPAIPAGTPAEVCSLCKFFVAFIDARLKKNKTEDEIIHELEKICALMPSAVKSDCVDILKDYGHYFIELATKQLAPDLICREVKLCPAAVYKEPKQSITPEILAGTSPEVCSLCKFLVTFVDTLLKVKKTEDEIIHELEKICALMPSSVKSECVDLLKDYGHYFIELVTKQLAPDLICREVKLCSAAVHKEKIDSHKLRTKNSLPLCTMCEFIVRYVENMLQKNTSQKEILHLLDDVCYYLPPSMKSECLSVVNNYGELILNYLVNKLNPDVVCKVLRLCSSHIKTERQKQVLRNESKPQYKAGPLCSTCELVVRYVDNMLKQNSTQEEILNVMDRVCEYLPPSIKSQCLSVVNNYGPYVLNLLVNELSPDVVCKVLGLCTSNMKKVNYERFAHHVDKLRLKSGPLCSTCELVVRYVDNLLKQNTTKAEILNLMDRVCEFLPPSIKSQCLSVVNNYGPYVLNLLINELSPDVVCKVLGLCTSNTKKVNIERFAHHVDKLRLKSGPLCSTCELVVRYVDNLLKQNTTKQEIVNLMDKVCEYLPPTIKTQCLAVVNNYGPFILNLLASELSPDVVCKALGLCTSSVNMENPKEFVHHMRKLKQNSGALCSTCQLVVRYVDNLLQQNATKKEIVDAMDKVCEYLPSSMKSECLSVVNKYGTVILDLLFKEFNPDIVCRVLGLCTFNSNMEKHKHHVNKMKQNSGPLCSTCELVVRYVDNMLKQNATQQEILNLMDKVCEYLPPSIKSQCLSVVNNYGRIVLNLLVNELNPDVVCKVLGLCTSNVKAVKNHQLFNVKAKAVSVSGPMCSTCELVVRYVDNLLLKNTSQEEVLKYMDKVCYLLPNKMRDECLSLVDLYGKAIYELLVKAVSPDFVCKVLRLCDSNAKKVSPAPNNWECTLCEMAMKELDSLIDSKQTKAEFKAALNKACGLLPPSVVPECRRFLDGYSSQILDLLVNFMQPSKICKFLHICPATRIMV